MQMKLKPRNEPNHSTAPQLCSVLPGCDTVSLGEQLLSFQRPFHPKDAGSVVVRSVRHYSPDTASCKSSTPRFHGHDKAKVLTCQCQRMAQHSFAGSDTVPTCRSSALPPSSRQKNVSADKCNIQHVSAHVSHSTQLCIPEHGSLLHHLPTDSTPKVTYSFTPNLTSGSFASQTESPSLSCNTLYCEAYLPLCGTLQGT